jgi:hypothetical protein
MNRTRSPITGMPRTSLDRKRTSGLSRDCGTPPGFGLTSPASLRSYGGTSRRIIRRHFVNHRSPFLPPSIRRGEFHDRREWLQCALQLVPTAQHPPSSPSRPQANLRNDDVLRRQLLSVFDNCSPASATAIPPARQHRPRHKIRTRLKAARPEKWVDAGTSATKCRQLAPKHQTTNTF